MKTPAQDIILAPVITEASMAGVANKKYTFKVAHGATKVDVKRAAEELFGVKVAKVNTISVRGRYPPPGPARRLHGCIQKGHCHADAGFQGHRVLRVYGVRPAPCKSLRKARLWRYDSDNNFIRKRERLWLSKSINRQRLAAAA